MILFSYVSLHRHNIERGQEMSWAPPWGCCLLWKKFSKSEEQNCMPPPPQFYSSIVLMYNSLVVSYHEFQIQYELSETLHLYWPCIYPNSFLLSRFNFPLSFCLTSLNIILTIKKTKFHSLVERLKSELIECWSKKNSGQSLGKKLRLNCWKTFN